MKYKFSESGFGQMGRYRNFENTAIPEYNIIDQQKYEANPQNCQHNFGFMFQILIPSNGIFPKIIIT